MLIIIAGHPRSGTTLLRNLCNAHPELNITMEFGNFAGMWQTYPRHAIWLLRRCFRRCHESFLVDVEYDQTPMSQKQRLFFVLRYLSALRPSINQVIHANEIENALYSCAISSSSKSGTPILGDKSAFYIFHLDQLVQSDIIKYIAIYRDCRDVVSSTLNKVRTDWRGRPFTTRFDNAAKVAERWVQSIESIEKHQDKIISLRYEDLIYNTAETLSTLARQIGIRVDGFQRNIIKTDRVGKHQLGLAHDELDTVISIAGPTMARMDYLT